MTTITTTGQIDNLLLIQNVTFSTAAENVGNKFYTALADVYSDVYYGNYSISNITSNQVDGYLYGAGGYVSLLGSGFYTSNPKFTSINFYGDDGFVFGVKGSFNASSLKLTEVGAYWNNEAIYIKGSLNESGYGRITTAGSYTNGLAMLLEGSISFSSSGISGSYKSISLKDDYGDSIALKGNVSYAAWEAESSSALTVDDLLNSQVIFAGSDTFNVPDAARAWHGFGGNDKMYGGGLADELHGDDGNDKLYGYDGNDLLVGGNGNDIIDGAAGNDTIFGEAGNDKITDTSGDNLVIDDIGNANVTVGDGNDTIITGSGNDKIVAHAGDNQIDAGDGNNKVTSLWGNDTILTGIGNDNINAGEGNNFIYAGGGNDKVVTGGGNDMIVGGVGADNLTGGAGNDSYVFDNLAQGGVDTITGFLTLSDVLVFDDEVFTSLVGGVSSANLVVGSGAVAQDGDDYLIFNTKGGKLYYDADGNGAGGAIQIATLKSVASLSVSDFVVEDHSVV